MNDKVENINLEGIREVINRILNEMKDDMKHYEEIIAILDSNDCTGSDSESLELDILKQVAAKVVSRNDYISKRTMSRTGQTDDDIVEKFKNLKNLYKKSKSN